MVHSLSLPVCPFCFVLPMHRAPNACPECSARITSFDRFRSWRGLRRLLRKLRG